MSTSFGDNELQLKLGHELGVEAILFCVIGFTIWIIFVMYLIREHQNLKKRRRGLARFHEQPCDDEEEEESAKYMISFFSSGNSSTYKDSPSAQVVMHLLGSLYPGKFHQLVASTPEETSQLFPPLGSDKFLVTEDVHLGRLLALVLRTEVEGSHPFWNCATVIVRDVTTNEAWFFDVDHEIGFPPRLLFPETQQELCAFKFSFLRRFRREIRNGQFGYFSFLFKSNTSVFTSFQRYVTTVGLYLLFFLTCFLFVDLVFSPGHSSEDLVKYGKLHEWLNPHPIRTNSDNSTTLYGESAASYWVIHVILPAFVSSAITTFIGFFMISFFREASKYETHFNEMDYVIGTALHEQARLKEKKRLAKLLPLDVQTVSETTIESTQIEQEIIDVGSEHWRIQESTPIIEDPTTEDPLTEDSILEDPRFEGPITNIYYPVPGNDEDERRDSKTEPGQRQNLIALFRRVMKRTLVLMKLRKSSVPAETLEITTAVRAASGEFVGRGSKASIMHAVDLTPLLTYPRRSRIFEPGSQTPPPEVLPIERSPYQQRMEMRRLFVGMDSSRLQKNSGGLRTFRFTSREWSLIKLVDISKDRRNYAYDLAYYDSTRKWYQPIPAWIVVILMILLSFAFIAVVAVKGKFHKSASEDQFAQTFMSSFVAGILIGTFICEPLKMVFIALYHAIKDKKLYKRIQRKAQKESRNKDSQ